MRLWLVLWVAVYHTYALTGKEKGHLDDVDFSAYSLGDSILWRVDMRSEYSSRSDYHLYHTIASIMAFSDETKDRFNAALGYVYLSRSFRYSQDSFADFLVSPR